MNTGSSFRNKVNIYLYKQIMIISILKLVWTINRIKRLSKINSNRYSLRNLRKVESFSAKSVRKDLSTNATSMSISKFTLVRKSISANSVTRDLLRRVIHKSMRKVTHRKRCMSATNVASDSSSLTKARIIQKYVQVLLYRFRRTRLLLHHSNNEEYNNNIKNDIKLI